MGDDHLEHLGVCGRILFRDSFGQDGVHWHSGFIKHGEFITWLSNCSLMEKDMIHGISSLAHCWCFVTVRPTWPLKQSFVQKERTRSLRQAVLCETVTAFYL
jgi:hypothetical protein